MLLHFLFVIVCNLIHFTFANVPDSVPDSTFIHLLQEFGREDVKQRNFEDLRQLVAIQSVSADPSRQHEVLQAADWLSQRMQNAGLRKVQVINTTGPQPIVYGEFMHADGKGPSGKRPTVLIYGHYDVQPEDPLDSWTHPPFQMTYDEAENNIYGRGVDDDKGGLLQALHAFEVLKNKELGSLPNIRFLFEGQEEVMSADLRQFLQTHKDMLLPTDLVLSADGRQTAENEGGIVLAMRGVVGMEVEVVTANADVHSGRFGGSIPNAAVALANLVSQLHESSGVVAVPGFYEGVKKPSDDEKMDVVAFEFDEAAERAELGIKAWHGEEPFDTIERRWHRPTLEIVGMHGGFIGQGMKTIVPHKASAKISCRLVPGQAPDDVYEKVAAYIKKVAPHYTTVHVRRMGGSADPWTSPRDNLGNRLATAVIQQLTSKPPKFVRDGATIPALAEFQSILGLEATPFGWGLAENIHAPNERLKSTMWHKGHAAWALVLNKLGEMAQDGENSAKLSTNKKKAAAAENEEL